jgi:hypothetical protein
MKIRTKENGKIAINAKNYLAVGAGDYPCGDNLYLIVAPSGGRRWLFRYQRKGIKDSMGLGSAKDVSLGDARKKALDHRRTLANGGDPKEVRDEAPCRGLPAVRSLRYRLARDLRKESQARIFAQQAQAPD